MTGDELRALVGDARRAREAGDAAAAAKLLEAVAQPTQAEFAALGVDDLKNVMQVAVLLADLADASLVGALFARSINAMQALEVAASEYILPLYNLRACYLKVGARKEANEILGHIVDAARHSAVVPVETMRALVELVPGFENAGYTEAAAALYRPVAASLLANPAIDWSVKLQAVARYGRLLLADDHADDAVQTYARVLALVESGGTHGSAAQEAGTEAPRPGTVEADHARMTLWNLTAEAYTRAGKSDEAEQAYETAVAIAEASADPDSREAGVLYHNAAGFWLAAGRQERFAQAAALTRRALAIAERLGEGSSPDYAGGLGQLANLEGGLGNTAEAQAQFDACFQAFESAAGASPADIADYRQDEGRFRLEAGRPGAAAASFSRAGELRGAIAGFPRETLADTLAWQGVAHFEDENFGAASEAFRRGLALLMERPDAEAGEGVAA